MVKITQDMLRNANTYIPLMEKENLAKQVAEKCVMPVSIGYRVKGQSVLYSMPSKAQEIPSMTNLCLMGIFASRYLKQGGDWADDIQMPANLYDEWGQSHVMNQTERLKTDKTVSHIVYDILHDYKELRWMVRQAIDTKLQQENDVVCRMHQILKDDIFGISELTPDMLAEALRSLEGMKSITVENRQKPDVQEGNRAEGGA